jgi:murein DD-endopeptidase MepM/ murein hydrolase activator NlpD
MKLRYTMLISSACAFILSACGTSGFDEIMARKQGQAAPPKPQQAEVQKKRQKTAATTKMRGYPMQRVPVAAKPAEKSPQVETMPVVAATAPVATELPPPSATAAVVQSSVIRIAASTTTVGKGETLFAVSRRTGVDITALAKANNFEKPYALEPGQQITVPATNYHVVQSGETASSIARKHRVSLTQLADLNIFDEIMSVQLGQKLKLPLTIIMPDASAPVQVAQNTNVSSTPQPAPTISTPPAEAAPADSEEMAALPQPAAGTTMPVFGWPLEGKIISAFGPKPNGQYNDGINIAARVGQPVRAAADGEVVYASNQLKGFGNLLLIRHKNGWLTAYAHNDGLLVKKGTKVQRGEVVARAGASGAVRTAQLHFEVRLNRKPINPVRVLPERNLTMAAVDLAPSE